MAISAEASGTQTATLATEHTLATITTAGVYVLTVDMNALTDDEELTIRAKVKVLSGGTTRLLREVTVRANDGLNGKVFLGVPIAITQELVYTIEQNNGTGRSLPWEVVDLGNTVVADATTGTSAPADRTPGSEHTLVTHTSGKTVVLFVDLTARTTTEAVELRLKYKVLTGGTTRVLWEFVSEGAPENEPIAMSPAIPALFEVVATLEETGGTERSYPLSLVSLD